MLRIRFTSTRPRLTSTPPISARSRRREICLAKFSSMRELLSEEVGCMFANVSKYRLLTRAARIGLLALFWAGNSPAQNKPPGHAVTLVEEPSSYTLSNGIVSARVDKSSGDLLSFRFNDTEMLATI